MFLLTATKNLVFRILVAVPTMFLLLGIVGTQSRGATLALSASLLYYLLYISKHKAFGIVMVLVVAFGVWTFAPEGYFSRMETLSSYEEDTSATGRIAAWGHAVEMALDNPFFGVGADSFNSAYGRFYRGEGDPQRWISTHSVYFKVLAEYGFTGIFVFLLLLYSNLSENHRTARLLRDNPEILDIPGTLPLFINMGLIAYAVAATFLSGLNYPHIYLITALTLSARWLARHQIHNESDRPREWQDNNNSTTVREGTGPLLNLTQSGQSQEDHTKHG
jgi:putative inorganic carbon (HCO3(-)) transporter